MDVKPRDAALQRIAFVFKRHPSLIAHDDRFDEELKASPPSDFRLNEFDRLSEDVQQMTAATQASASHHIVTVEQFCRLAEGYAGADPKGWGRLLASWRREQMMESAPEWRRTIWWLMGI